MPRPRQRVRLQDGLKLDLNRLARKGFAQTGANIGARGIKWTHSYRGEIASGMISADMSGRDGGWFRIQLGSLDQWITLVSRPRHLPGWQARAGTARDTACRGASDVAWTPLKLTVVCMGQLQSKFIIRRFRYAVSGKCGCVSPLFTMGQTGT